MTDRRTEALEGFWGPPKTKIKPVLTEQPCVSECLYVSVCIHTCMCLYVCMSVLWHACLSPNPSLTLVPRDNRPTPDPALHCLALQSQLQKRMRMGTVFHPCGGQSVWIHQPSLGSSTLGSGAQQAPSSPLQPPLAPKTTEAFELTPGLQTPKTCLCLASVGVYWWLTPSLCLWTCQSRSIALQHYDRTAMLYDNMSLGRRSVAIWMNMCFKLLLHMDAWEKTFTSLYHRFISWIFSQISLLNPGHTQLECFFLIHYSVQKFLELLCQAVLCIACKWKTSTFPLMVHKAPHSFNKEQQQSREKKGMRQNQSGNHNKPSASSPQLSKNLTKTAIKEIKCLLLISTWYILLVCMCTGECRYGFLIKSLDCRLKWTVT